MAKYRKISKVVEAEQFNYIDGISGPKTTELAQSLGLSTNGPSVLWEVTTAQGWKIVYSGYWIVTQSDGRKYVYKQEEFAQIYEPVPEGE